MSQHFEKELREIKNRLLVLSGKVEEQVEGSYRAWTGLNTKLAEEIIEKDVFIDEFEVALEEDCLKILALYQPVAIDLRFIIATMKINSDLERIGDLAVNIAARSKNIGKTTEFNDFLDFDEMYMATKTMLNDSIDSLVDQDVEKARKVLSYDQEVDRFHRRTYKWVFEKTKERPDWVEFYVNQVSISRYIERIADYATNIAEDVIYMIDGQIVRHRPDVIE